MRPTKLDVAELDAPAKPLILLADRPLRRGICDPLLAELAALERWGELAAEVRRRQAHGVRRQALEPPGGFAHPGGARRRARALDLGGHRA